MSLRMRRGGAPTPEPPPPSGATFGPVQGAQFVRDNAGPDPVTNPGGGVAFSPSSNIGSLITANPSNTVFVASQTGTYTNFRGVSYSNKHPRFYFPGNALTDYSITGTGAVGQIGLQGSSGGLEVYGGNWSGYGGQPDTSGSAIQAYGGGTIIRDAVFTGNARGIAMQSVSAGNTYAITRCKFLNNLRTSITHGSSAGFHGAPVLDACLIQGGNAGQNDPGGNAGGMKMATTGGLIIRNCWSKNNVGFGLWCDAENINTTWNDNVIENNLGIAPVPGAGGAFFEISGGGCVIEHNYITGNGDPTNANYPYNGVQLIISNSPCDGTGPTLTQLDLRSEIRYNDIDCSGYRSPIVLYNHDAHADSNRTRNWYVHHNRMWQRGSTGQSRAGLCDASHISAKTGDLGTSPGAPGLCLFDYNEYHVANVGGDYWEHDTAHLSPGAMSWLEFKARGHEIHGTLTTI